MIDLYTWMTPNGHKVSIMLEETALEYRVHPVNIAEGAQFEREFLAISPNNKIPAIVDHDGPGGDPIALFESGAILMYLAEKTGRFTSSDPRVRWEILQWLVFQVAGVGPMLGQLGHFRFSATENVPYAVRRYADEANRLFGVIDKRLEDRPFLAGDYSIADIATFPWCARYEGLGVEIARFPRVDRWIETIAERPAVQRGLNTL